MDQTVEQRLADLDEQKETILNGTHPALVSQKEAFALERDKQVKIADNERVIRIGQINALFEFQVKAANDIRKRAEREATEKLLEELERTRKRVQYTTGKPGTLQERERVGTRLLRSMRTKSKEKEKEGPLYQTLNGYGTTAPSEPDNNKINYSIPEPEILADLKFLQATLVPAEEPKTEQPGASTIASPEETEASIERRKLVLSNGGLVLRENDQIEFSKIVVPMSEQANSTRTVPLEEYSLVGKIKTMNAKRDDIEVLLLDGALVRVPLYHIRSGRVKVQKHDAEARQFQSVGTVAF